MGQPVEALRKTQQVLGRSQVSLEQVIEGRASGDDGGFCLLDLLADDDPEGIPGESLERQELTRLLQEAIAALPPREALIVDALYRQGQSMRAISPLLGISESRVSQLHTRAVTLVREHVHHALGLAARPAVPPQPRRTGSGHAAPHTPPYPRAA
jgi:RNA polymerase sigma factor for flagellar operon FliA